MPSETTVDETTPVTPGKMNFLRGRQLSFVNIVTYVLLIGFALGAFIMSCAFANNRGYGLEIREHTYRSLHAMQYPILSDYTTLNELSGVSFLTPALPARLASKWEIQNMLGVPKNRLARTDNMIYPTIDQTDWMKDMLSLRNGNTQNTQALAQSLFDVKSALMDNQTQNYCPRSHEDERTWLTRTHQQNTTDMTEKYKHYMHYKFNTEHATLCLSNRIAPMVLAHVANQIYSMFASQNTVVLMLYIANTNALFGFIIALYKWYGASVGNKSFSEITSRHLHGWFSVLFCLLPPLLAIPLVTDYFERKDDNGITSDNRAVGSYILGMWTLLFSFLYVSVLPAFSVVLERTTVSTKQVDPPVIEGTKNPDAALNRKHENTLESLAAQRPVIAFAYWNLLQAPCFVMLALATQAYGIDTYMQFVVFGTIASCVLDVLHARVMIILRVMENLDPKQHHTMHSWWAFGVFLVMHVLVVLGIYAKISQQNMDAAGVALVILVLSTQVCQNFVFLAFQTMTKWSCFNPHEEHMPYEAKLFNVGLLWHVVITLSAFVCALVANGTSS